MANPGWGGDREGLGFVMGDAPVQYRNSQGPPRLGFHSCFSARSGLPGKITLRCGTRGGIISIESAMIMGSTVEVCESVEAISILNIDCVRR
jgi:hypothetical protein